MNTAEYFDMLRKMEANSRSHAPAHPKKRNLTDGRSDKQLPIEPKPPETDPYEERLVE